MSVLAVIPCYNDGKHIGEVIEKVKKHNKDVLVVDDGSTDNNGVIKREGVDVIRMERNMGKGVALKAGFGYAVKNNFDAVITIDADGQHNPSEIPKFLVSDADIIIGNRMWNLEHMPLSRIIANKFSSFVLSLICRQRILDSQSGYRFIKTDVLRKVKVDESGYMAETEFLIKASRAGFKVRYVPIETIYGAESSYINPFSIVVDFIRVVLRNF